MESGKGANRYQARIQGYIAHSHKMLNASKHTHNVKNLPTFKVEVEFTYILPSLLPLFHSQHVNKMLK